MAKKMKIGKRKSGVGFSAFSVGTRSLKAIPQSDPARGA
jgi:hypothetical protein